MKNIRTPKLIFFFFFGAMITCFILSTSCGPGETPPEEDNEITEVGYATDEINHTHKKGVPPSGDPCPQEIEESIKVYCYKNDTFTGCDADSVVLSDVNPMTAVGLSAEFEAGGKTATFNGTEGDVKNIKLQFTCDIAESFVHTYRLTFYKDGVEVGTEDVTVNVTVT